jgi:hypothetical protein
VDRRIAASWSFEGEFHSTADGTTVLVAAGDYVLTKRFSSKEERRRVVAAVYDPHRIASPLVGFENHLNYFHAGGNGMPEHGKRIGPVSQFLALRPPFPSV